MPQQQVGRASADAHALQDRGIGRQPKAAVSRMAKDQAGNAAPREVLNDGPMNLPSVRPGSVACRQIRSANPFLSGLPVGRGGRFEPASNRYQPGGGYKGCVRESGSKAVRRQFEGRFEGSFFDLYN